MYCGKCGKKIESTAGVCYSCKTDPVFYGPVFPCPTCAALRAEVGRYLSALRRIAGELGEFADPCPTCAAKDAVVDAVRVYLLGNQHTCPDDCSSYNALSSALAAYDKGENDDRAK